jgi:hypothetical protein
MNYSCLWCTRAVCCNQAMSQACAVSSPLCEVSERNRDVTPIEKSPETYLSPPGTRSTISAMAPNDSEEVRLQCYGESSPTNQSRTVHFGTDSALAAVYRVLSTKLQSKAEEW